MDERDPGWMERSIQPDWGLITVRLLDPSQAPRLWQEVARLWDWLETETEHGFMPSQMDKFEGATASVDLYGSDWALFKLKELLAGRGTLEFKVLPDDQIPSLPPRPRTTRKPYIPRRKR
jgi:hypothetical protein